jgi:copper chaperone
MRRSNNRDVLQFEVEGMHCSNCGILIDECVEELQGVRSSRTKVRKGMTLVELEASAVPPEVIAAAISDLGYRARPVMKRKDNE